MGGSHGNRVVKEHDCLGRLKGFSDGLNKSLEQETACVPWGHAPYMLHAGYGLLNFHNELPDEFNDEEPEERSLEPKEALLIYVWNSVLTWVIACSKFL